MTPTREDLELAARFAGVILGLERHGVTVARIDNAWRLWTPQLPSADAFVLLAKVLPIVLQGPKLFISTDVAANLFAMECALDPENGMDDDAIKVLCATAFDFAVAIQRDRENSND